MRRAPVLRGKWIRAVRRRTEDKALAAKLRLNVTVSRGDVEPHRRRTVRRARNGPRRIRDHFGRDDVTVIAIRPRKVFDLEFLATLRAMHEDLENEVPYLDEVTSLVNARSTRGEGNELIIEDLLEDWPRNAVDLAALEERVFANPLYLDSLISRDGSLTTVTLEPIGT